ncbi:MAG: hypothetical protein AB1420_16005 [Bacillota bacterium]
MMIDLRLFIIEGKKDKRVIDLAHKLGNIKRAFYFMRDEIITYPDEFDDWYYPQQTLFENESSDCEDKAMTLTTLLEILGYNAYVYIFQAKKDENHAVVIVDNVVLDPTFDKMEMNEIASIFIPNYYLKPIVKFNSKELAVFDEERYEKLL